MAGIRTQGRFANGYRFYSFPFLRIATSNQIPIMAAAEKSRMPISEIP